MSNNSLCLIFIGCLLHIVFCYLSLHGMGNQAGFLFRYVYLISCHGAVEYSVQCVPISSPSWKIQSTVQPTSVNTAVKKGLPARMLCGVLHSNLASTCCDPTHTPAGSKFGVSSASHSRASWVRV